MSRPLRIQYPGALYHVMNRGDRGEDIYLDDKDRLRFLETLGQACEKTGWQIHALCLMRNHFHNHFGRERRETAEAGARRIIAETLRKARLTSEGLKLLSANHRIRVELALRLRRETTMDLKWIAQELAVGSWKYLSNLLSKEPHPSRQTEFAL